MCSSGELVKSGYSVSDCVGVSEGNSAGAAHSVGSLSFELFGVVDGFEVEFSGYFDG